MERSVWAVAAAWRVSKEVRGRGLDSRRMRHEAVPGCRLGRKPRAPISTPDT